MVDPIYYIYVRVILYHFYTAPVSTQVRTHFHPEPFQGLNQEENQTHYAERSRARPRKKGYKKTRDFTATAAVLIPQDFANANLLYRALQSTSSSIHA